MNLTGAPVRVIPIKVDLTESAQGTGAGDQEPELVSLYEASRKIYPRSVKGWFANWRWFVVIATQLVFYGLPWLTWGERQAVLFDLAARKFYILGLVLWPQDFIYLAVLLVIAAYSLFLFTAIGGRLWCGYACPQTVYTEIFMWVERRIEGDRNRRIQLDAEPMGARKLALKAAKHGIWIAIGLWTGFTFVGYFTPIGMLGAEVMSLSLGPWETFWVLFYGFATYGNAGWMREQVCKYMCPYARFQSAMFDADTLIVTYDANRGEPRGARSRKADPAVLGLGACVDCNMCVHVCPTGIDIRQGLQYECIGCAGCIDVCNQVMDRMGYARGLIRYSSERAMNDGLPPAEIWRHLMRPRTLIYGAVLVVIVACWAASLSLRKPLKVDVIRDRGSMARVVEDGRIENVYRLQIMNASESAQRFLIGVEGLPGIEVASEKIVEVQAASARFVPVRVQLPADYGSRGVAPGSRPIEFDVSVVNQESIRVEEKSVFVVPR